MSGDIGGTKTVLALFPAGGVPKNPQHKISYPSQEYRSLEEILDKYLVEGRDRVHRACFDVAGPVVEGRAEITNLPWVIEEGQLKARLGAPVSLINDMNAIAHMVAHVADEDLVPLLPGTAVKGGARAVIAPGTGLGEGFLVWSGGRYLPYGSEGGHADFAPRDRLQTDLLLYLEERFGHISYERVCSGIGLPNLYDFLRHSGRCHEPKWLHDALAGASDRTQLVVQFALEGKAEICTATLDLFTGILGAEAANLALKVLATGGVYLAGGIPRRILPWLKKPIFRDKFIDKGRLSELLGRIPVFVVRNPDTALMGAAWHALEM